MGLQETKVSIASKLDRPEVGRRPRYRKFESIPLQRGVSCEPEFRPASPIGWLWFLEERLSQARGERAASRMHLAPRNVGVEAGTESSNLLCSSAESAANLTSSVSAHRDEDRYDFVNRVVMFTFYR